MIEQLQNMKAPKFLRYLFFIAYSFYRRFTSERNDAHFTAMGLLAIPAQAVGLGVVFWQGKRVDKIGVIFNLIITALLFFFWFWYKKKWVLYIEEFKHIGRKRQLWGGVYLLLYFLICFSFVFLPILLDEVFDIELIKRNNL